MVKWVCNHEFFMFRSGSTWFYFGNELGFKCVKMRRTCEILKNEVTLWNKNAVNVFPR